MCVSMALLVTVCGVCVICVRVRRHVQFDSMSGQASRQLVYEQLYYSVVILALSRHRARSQSRNAIYFSTLWA